MLTPETLVASRISADPEPRLPSSSDDGGASEPSSSSEDSEVLRPSPPQRVGRNRACS